MIGTACLSGCAGDAVVLSEEEERKWEQMQNDTFADVQIPDFAVEAMDGKLVTRADCFEAYDLILVNIWGTFCGPCVEEMPELAKLYHHLPDRVNMITICVDVKKDESSRKFAEKVLKESGADFKTLIPDALLEQSLTELVTAYPTTVFADSDGKLVGGPYFGSQDEEGYLEAIEERLQQIQKTEGAEKNGTKA